MHKQPTFSRSFLCATLALGLLFALAVLLPNILQRFDTEYAFQGIEMMPTDSEIHYAARVREAYDGYGTVANTYAWTPKDQPYLLPGYPERAIALLAPLFQGPLGAFYAGKIFLCMAMVVVMVAFLTSITHRPWISLTSVCALLFVEVLLSAPWSVQEILTEGFQYWFLRFARPVQPQWSVTWFYSALLLLSFWVQQRRTIYIVFSALCTAVLLYSTVYAWTYIGATMLFLCGWYAYKKDPLRIKDLLIFAAVFVACSPLYLHNLWQLLHHEHYAETAMRMGLIDDRSVVWGVWLLVFVGVGFLGKKFFPKVQPLVPALAFGAVLAMNQQLITGRALQVHHYQWYYVMPLASMLAIIIVLTLTSQAKITLRIQQISIGILVVLGVSFGFTQQYFAYGRARDAWGTIQPAASALSYLNEAGKPGEVIVAADTNDALHYMLAVYTPLELTGVLAGTYVVPDTRVRDALFLRYWLQGVTPTQAQSDFHDVYRIDLSGFIHGVYYNEVGGSYESIPDERVDQLAAEYAEDYKRTLTNRIALHSLDYLLLTPNSPNTSQIRELSARGTVVFEDQGYTVISLAQ